MRHPRHKPTAHKFEPRIRFNWGYHDGANDVIKGRRVRSMTGHFDRFYAQGYEAGVDDARAGDYCDDSSVAWAHRKAGR